MADSFSSRDCTDAEGSSSESNMSLSVGYFPCEDTSSYENTISCEDTSPKKPSTPFVPLIQGKWRIESIGRLLGRRDQIQDDPEQFCKLSIILAWDTDTDSNHSESITAWGPHEDNQLLDQCPEEKTQLTLNKLDGLLQKLETCLEIQKDDGDDESVLPESALEEKLQLSSSPPPDMTQLSHEEHDTCQDLPKFDPPENEDVIQLPQIPARPEKRELAKKISQATGSQRTRASTTDNSPVSSHQPGEEHAHSRAQALSCLNLRWVFRWLRQQVLSSCWGRQHPKKAAANPYQSTQKKRLSYRSKRVQPQECLEL